MSSVIIIDSKGLSVKTDKVRHEIISIGKNYRPNNYVGNSVGFRRFSGSVFDIKNREAHRSNIKKLKKKNHANKTLHKGCTK
jgi:choline kinase